MYHILGNALDSNDGNPALLDPATGALSRQAFVLRLEEAAALAARLGCGVSVVAVDLRDAEALCCAHGGESVDRVLAVMVDRLWALARRSDSVARLGPARLGILLPATDRTGAARYAARLLPRLTSPYRCGHSLINATVDLTVVGTDTGEIPDSAELLSAIGC